MSLGPIMLDLDGSALSDEEKDLLQHPLTGGVILFSRNYESTEQITELVAAIHNIRSPNLLVAVDHEGGRIQRFREGFTKLPAGELIGTVFDKNNDEGIQLALNTGWLMATELRAVGIDFSFAPVLDLHKRISKVIGDRSFHRDPDAVTQLAKAYMQGMRKAGMSAVGKHFPGHGSVVEDSHLAVPVDYRRFEDIQLDDLIPFERLIHAGLAAIMPAHVIYPVVDDKPAGYSSKWLKDILRGQYRFQGTIFSDDISMAGAEIAGDYVSRASSATSAGCDMVLVCNKREAVINILDKFDYNPDPVSQVRLIRMHGKNHLTVKQMKGDTQWQSISREIAELDITPELDLGDDAV